MPPNGTHSSQSRDLMGAWASDCPATWWEQVEIGGLLNESLEVINNLFPGRPAHCLTGAMVGLIWGTTNTRVESTNTSEKEPLRFTWYQFKEICLAYLIKDLINRTV